MSQCATMQDIFARSVPEPNTGCHLWTRSTNAEGYGHMRDGGRLRVAHRIVWELLRGVIPSGMCVCHRCDTPGCVNADHLFLGTKGDNNRDRAAKGRTVSHVGSRNGRSKLTEAEVREIRILAATGESQRSLAVRFGVVKTAIANIVHGVTWQAAKGEDET